LQMPVHARVELEQGIPETSSGTASLQAQRLLTTIVETVV